MLEMLHRELVTVVEKALIHTWQGLDDLGSDLGQHEWLGSLGFAGKQPCWGSPKVGNER